MRWPSFGPWEQRRTQPPSEVGWSLQWKTTVWYSCLYSILGWSVVPWPSLRPPSAQYCPSLVYMRVAFAPYLLRVGPPSAQATRTLCLRWPSPATGPCWRRGAWTGRCACGTPQLRSRRPSWRGPPEASRQGALGHRDDPARRGTPFACREGTAPLACEWLTGGRARQWTAAQLAPAHSTCCKGCKELQHYLVALQ